MHDSVHRSLLSGCSRSFERPCRIVHPHIDTLDKQLGKRNVIVRHKHDLSDEPVLLRDIHYHLYKVLPRLVRRMSLAGKDELYRTVRVVDDIIEPVKVPEQEVCPLVGCETPCESDCKHIVAERILYGHNLTRRIMVGCRRIGETVLDSSYKLGPQCCPHIPYLCVGHLVYSLEA